VWNDCTENEGVKLDLVLEMVTKKTMSHIVYVLLLVFLFLSGVQNGLCARNPAGDFVVVSTEKTYDAGNATMAFQLSLDPGDAIVGGMTFSIDYDGSAYQFIGLEKSPITARSLVVHKFEKGKIRFGFIDMQGISNKGIVFTLRFSLRDDAAKNSRISIHTATCSDHRGNLMPVTQPTLTGHP
jgi:hypothetical protein